MKSRCTGTRFFAHVRCPCGSKKFRLLHTGSTWQDKYGDKFPKDTKVGDGYFLVIKAVCTLCQASHLLFDKTLHGWNGIVSRADSPSAVQPDLVAWNCSRCGQLVHTATIAVFGEGREDAIQESSGFLDDSNWQEAFGSIQIATKCCNCGHKAPTWLSYETM